jgi:2-dehydro-3-deoxy-D-arabinonate dehydratase
MKIYKVNNGSVIFDGNTYKLIHLDWNVLLIQDDLRTYLTDLLDKGQPTQLQDHKILKPIGDNQELWACGVTYLRSKIGRQEESKTSGGSDFYEKVYHADRPEVFFKANPARIVGHQEGIRIRQDSSWDVPEPELTLVVSPSGKINAYTIGNDMSSRSIEGENPLYLPQAKTYDACAALGPCLSLTNPFDDTNTKIHLEIVRKDMSVFTGEVELSQMKRKAEELVSYVYKECSFPFGCFIMTGTGIVPPNDFTLQKGDIVHIAIDGIGTLTNTVKTDKM